MEGATKGLSAAQARVEALEKEKFDLLAQVEELQQRVGASSLPAPPPPPPPPMFTAVHAQDNLKKKIGALKTKLQGSSQDDQLSKKIVFLSVLLFLFSQTEMKTETITITMTRRLACSSDG